ncbi:outer membrane protein assembly factor BamE [Shimia abyssi]|uniref:Beta-barrel assembly machine subunit BamE n=1 Tax=Shimia abyssi TaxID=1662395 RepID=A0A2P8FIQ3_9RHOB|nr:outer membrane protein assembly factor BamE [Shimia abyssi]PSL21596.1 Beta-barrel assembly machine subunit BamE [Shimia abyssi]
MSTGSKALKWAVFGAALAVSVACTTQYRNHGYVPTPEELAAVTLGVDTRDTVIEAIGSPSAGGVLKDGDFYYVRSQFTHYGPRKPRVVERQIVAINFDSNGVARNLTHFSLADGQVVPLVRRITDSDLGNISFLQQLAGNLGNFDPSTFAGGGAL